MTQDSIDKHLYTAKEIIESVKGSSLSMEVRKHKAVDLAAHMLSSALKMVKKKEKERFAELARMMQDPSGKAFFTAVTDQCFRSKNPERIADQLIHLLDLYGIPTFLSPQKRLSLHMFRLLAPRFPSSMVALTLKYLRNELEDIVLPGESKSFKKHVQQRKHEGYHLNINHLGEAILSESEAEARLQIYLKDLTDKDIECISIKISTIYSQINLISWENTLEKIAERLRRLYRAAIANKYERIDGTNFFKFVYLDMEEYRDLHLTKEVFIKVLNEEEFFHFSAGIVLQAYLPESIYIQQELTEWAKERVEKGGAPIKIRIVKGANLAMEQVEASLHCWPQAPYKYKNETDANYKRMLLYGMHPQRAKIVRLGVATHNLFDIALAILLSSENKIEEYVSFEMLEGMAGPTQRVVKELVNDLLLYCPVARKEDFQHVIAYLLRRLDENTGRENFLRHSFHLEVGDKQWENQVSHFLEACEMISEVSDKPRKVQSRLHLSMQLNEDIEPFENEPDTDFSIAENRIWAKQVIEKWQKKQISPLPLIIDGKEIQEKDPQGKGFDPSSDNEPFYLYSMASWPQIDKALTAAKHAEKKWIQKPIEKRFELLRKTANRLREKRGDLIGSMIADGGKTFIEADIEISEAIDFCEYYLSQMMKINASKDLETFPKGITLIIPPWNFPVSIPCGGIAAALVAGNPVLFKPSSLTVLSAYLLAEAFWEAGVPKDLLQFIPCDSATTGKKLIADPRVITVALTGSSETAREFYLIRPDLNLLAETGGKNPIIITDLSDRDLAVKDLLQSAFGHNGQKCSAASLVILEKEVYDDPHFLKNLKEAAESMHVGSNWDCSSKITPLIRSPDEKLLRGLTTLDEGETWLLKPEKKTSMPNLWSPGIKLGVKKGSFMHTTELFGPVLGVMRAENFDHAISLANGTPYGLTSGLQSLDDREKKKWKQLIIAGNCYINRSITGAIVRRQPFGGTKASSFGQGFKAGGPNYITQFMTIKQKSIPKEKFPVNEWVNLLSGVLDKFELNSEDLTMWYTSVSNYAFWWKRFQHGRDPSKILGEDNILYFVPHKKMCVRIYYHDKPIDYLRIFAAALTCGTPLQISWESAKEDFPPHINWGPLLPIFNIVIEEEQTFLKRIRLGDIKRLRLLSKPSDQLLKVAAEKACFVNTATVLANGRIELFHYLREVAFSHAYHRYGNLGSREEELRRPVL